MNPTVETDIDFSNHFISEIKSIIVQSRLIDEILVVAPPYEDMKHNTDLIVLEANQLRFVCRVRRPEMLEKYGKEFTIRYARSNEAKTEFQKIIEGWGSYIFYGFSGYDYKLKKWFIGDLTVFRSWYFDQLRLNNGKEPSSPIPNKDNSSTFLPFKINDLPKEFIIAQSKDLSDWMSGNQ